MKIYILGICGTFMSGVAQLAIQKGFQVSGCDENIYPPISDVLKDLGVKIDKGYSEKYYSENTDLFIIGNVVSRGNPLMEKILNEDKSFSSGPEFLFNYVLKDRHVVSIAGTHGKTTTSAMITKILLDFGIDAGYLIAGKVKDFSNSAELGNDKLFVIESDEYDTAFFDKRSKFIHYKPSTLLINNLEFDHADIFNNLDDIQKQFHHLIRSLPQNVKVLFPFGDDNIQTLLKNGFYSIKEPFNFEFSEKGWSMIINENKTSDFKVCFNGELVSEISLKLIGEHNLRNAFAAFLTALSLGVTPNSITNSLLNFKGVAKRMDLLGEKNTVSVYDDFAHHPTAIKLSLEALKKADSSRKIICLLEMRSNTMLSGFHDEKIPEAVSNADEVYLFSKNETQAKKIISQDPKINFCESKEEFLKILRKKNYQKTNIICFSNGSFGGIQSEIFKNL